MMTEPVACNINWVKLDKSVHYPSKDVSSGWNKISYRMRSSLHVGVGISHMYTWFHVQICRHTCRRSESGKTD